MKPSLNSIVSYLGCVFGLILFTGCAHDSNRELGARGHFEGSYIQEDAQSLTAAAVLNARLNGIAKNIALEETERLLQLRWTDDRVKAYAGNLTGLFDANVKRHQFASLHLEEEIITFRELQTAFAIAACRTEIAALELIRDRLRDGYPAAATRLVSTHLGNLRLGWSDLGSEFGTRQLISTELPRITIWSLNSENKNKVMLVRDEHRASLLRSLNELCESRVALFHLPSDPAFYLLPRESFEDKARQASFDKTLADLTRELIKRRILADWLSQGSAFIGTHARISLISDYRDTFFGPFDSIRDLLGQLRDEPKYREACSVRFQKVVFTDAEYHNYIQSLAEVIPTRTREGLNEYLSFSAEVYEGGSLSFGDTKEITPLSATYGNFDVDALGKAMQISDILDAGATGLAVVGIAAAPATGGGSLLLTIAGTAFNAAMLLKDFVLEPEVGRVQVSEMTANVQGSLVQRLIFDSGSLADDTFHKLDHGFEHLVSSTPL